MDTLTFERHYPSLWNFLVANFPDSYVDGLTDLEVAKQYGELERPDERRRTIQQGRHLLSEEPFPWEAISREANRSFANAEAARAWLTEMLDAVDAATPRTGS